MKPIIYSFQSELEIAALIKALEHLRVVFSPRKTDILYKLSAATDAGSFLVYNSVSVSAYHASKSSSLTTSDIIYAKAGNSLVSRSVSFLRRMAAMFSASVLTISRADYLVASSNSLFFMISETTKISLAMQPPQTSPWEAVSSIMEASES